MSDGGDEQRADHQQEGLEIGPVGAGEAVQGPDEGVLREDLERPARDRGDHGDASAGHAGQEQVARPHPHQRRLRPDGSSSSTTSAMSSARSRFASSGEERDERGFRALASHDLDPQLHHSEEPVRELLHHVHALDPCGWQRPLPTLQQPAAHDGASRPSSRYQKRAHRIADPTTASEPATIVNVSGPPSPPRNARKMRGTAKPPTRPEIHTAMAAGWSRRQAPIPSAATVLRVPVGPRWDRVRRSGFLQPWRAPLARPLPRSGARPGILAALPAAV